MRKPSTVLLLAIIIGAVTSALTYRHLRVLGAEVEAARRPPEPTVDVVVANESIPMGTRLEARHVRRVAWPAGLEPEGAIHDPEGAIGHVARVTIEKNQPLGATYLLDRTEGLLPLAIRPGMRAMSVRVDEVSGVSGFIVPNGRVDVVGVGSSDGASGGEQWSKVVLQNLRVLATGHKVEQRDGEPVEVPTVTLLVSPEEAEKLALAGRLEAVRLALRGHDDEAAVATPGISKSALLDGEARTGRTAAVVKSERRAGASVAILLGEKLTYQEIP
jgi:pilus assembly protein CpaB